MPSHSTFNRCSSPSVTGSAAAHFDSEFSMVPDFGLVPLQNLNPTLDLDFTTDVKLEWKNINVTNPKTDRPGVALNYENTKMDLLKFGTQFIGPTGGQVKDVLTHQDVEGSDHCPVTMIL